MIAGYFLRGLLISLVFGAPAGAVDAYFRKKVTDHIYKWLDRILGCLMALFGLVMMIQGIIKN